MVQQFWCLDTLFCCKQELLTLKQMLIKSKVNSQAVSTRGHLLSCNISCGILVYGIYFTKKAGNLIQYSRQYFKNFMINKGRQSKAY